MKVMDFVRGEKTEPMRFHIDAERLESGFKYKAYIYEEKDGKVVNTKVGHVYADTKLGLKLGVWWECRQIKKKAVRMAKGDPKPWKVKL